MHWPFEIFLNVRSVALSSVLFMEVGRSSPRRSSIFILLTEKNKDTFVHSKLIAVAAWKACTVNHTVMLPVIILGMFLGLGGWLVKDRDC